MSKSNKKNRKKRNDKFPLTLHPTQQYCKKIKGKLYYFGTNKKQALQRYLEDAAILHSGKVVTRQSDKESISIKYLCNLYLEQQEYRVSVDQIKMRQVYDQTLLLRDFVKFVGPNRIVSDISTMDIQNYIRKQIRAKKSANTINNRIAAVKAMFNWALDNEIIGNSPNLKAIKKITKTTQEKPIFNMSQIQTIMKIADSQMKAMILLGLNCGFGCTDCAELEWKNLDLENSRVVFPRGKTGISRNLVLWPETVAALKNVSKKDKLVFYTAKGNPWVEVTHGVDKFGNEKISKNDAVSRKFAKLLKKAGIKVPKGVGFYTLRRTAATLAARSGDPFAVQKLLGHADLKMASVYVQDISEQTDRAINNSRKLIISNDS